ncbi:hypothetical protein AA958_18890 [Streptomyces sp. CNQ-509]|uniref:hypothetical protein n=1 Tax=Streptomyces sp. CNQ-509 TaxID=444103 RepID=UPI00062DECA6|nr:hypothetical protein [Streptomyces sp. CNQ-509]AKH83919.1 hypothetical protein AA958_18890 [Streptomyces sp. CNQ-509]
MPTVEQLLDVRRDPHSGELLARGGDLAAHSILQRTGFVAVVRVHETYHRAPTGLAKDDEDRLGTEAVARLRTAGYHIDCDDAFDTDARPAGYLPLGAGVAHLADLLREATTTAEAADVLTEVTAAHDGVLAALEDVLLAAAEFHDGLGDAADPHIAQRLRHLADHHLRAVRTDLACTRDALADHPGRSTCTEQVPAGEPERSAVCACPPPPGGVPPAPPDVAAVLRR